MARRRAASSSRGPDRDPRPEADFLVTVGHKWLLGPFGLGYLYVAEEHRRGKPLEENWIAREGSDDFARLVDYRDEYQPGARRFDVGGRTNFELTPTAIAALEQIVEWQVPRVAGALAERNCFVARRGASLRISPHLHTTGADVECLLDGLASTLSESAPGRL